MLVVSAEGDHIKVTASQYPFPTVCADNQSTDWFHSISRTLKWNERERQKSFVVVVRLPLLFYARRSLTPSHMQEEGHKKPMSRQNSTTSKASAGATFASSKARSAAKSEADFGDEEDESESEDELDDEEEEEEEGNSEDEAFDIDDLSSENHTNSSSPSNAPEDPTSVVPPLPTNAVPAAVENPFATHALPPKPNAPGHAHASPPPPLHNFTLRDTLTSSAASSVAELNDDPRFRDPAPRPPRLSSRHSASAIPQTSTYSSSAPPGGAPSAGGGATRMSPAVARRRERGEEGDRDHLRESLSVKRSVGAGSGRWNRSKERSPRTPKVDEQKESGHGGNGGGFAFAVVGADSDTSVVRRAERS